MAYTKQTWANLPNQTTPLSAARLGNIENGIEAASTAAGTDIADAGALYVATNVEGALAEVKAQVVALPGTPDAVVASLVDNSASATTTALNGRYGALKKFPVAQYRLSTDTDTQAIQRTIDAADAYLAGLPAVSSYSLLGRAAEVQIGGGVYTITSGLTVNRQGIRLVGEGNHQTRIEFNLNASTDGITFTGPVAAYGWSWGISDMTLIATTLHTSVRDIVKVNSPALFHMEDVSVYSAGRYNINIDFCIATTMERVQSYAAKSAALYVQNTTSVSTSFSARDCYFSETKEGPNVHIKSCYGATFTSCIFESAGADVNTNAYGILIEQGTVTLIASYFENNARADIKAGTVGLTYLTVSGFLSSNGTYTVAGEPHVSVGQYVRMCSINGATMSVRTKSIEIHPSAQYVHGGGINWGVQIPVMSDASDIMLCYGVCLFGQDVATGDMRWFGRVIPRFDTVTVTNRLGIGDGLVGAPALYFNDDTNTGIWGSDTDSVSLVGNGEHLFKFQPGQNWSLQPFRVTRINYGVETVAPADMSGAGTPEGVIGAPTGSTYRRTNGGAGTSFYVKETGGTGNTGWVGK